MLNFQPISMYFITLFVYHMTVDQIEPSNKRGIIVRNIIRMYESHFYNKKDGLNC